MFCPDCGANTITACTACGEQIKGTMRIGKQTFGKVEVIPKFCDNCGSPYPWTIATQQTAYELIEFSEDSNESDKEHLKATTTNVHLLCREG